jgi:hypothetical protein
MDNAKQYQLEKIQRDRIKSILYGEKLDTILRNISNAAGAMREVLEQGTSDRQNWLVAQMQNGEVTPMKILNESIDALRSGDLVEQALACLDEIAKIRRVAHAEHEIEKSEERIRQSRRELEAIGPIKEYP